MFVVPDYRVPRFRPGQDVQTFIRELGAASCHNRALYEFALSAGRLTVCPPSLAGEMRRALDYARLMRRLPAAARVAQIVGERRAPVSTTMLAVKINASTRTAFNYALALEHIGLLRRPSPKGGWVAAMERWN